MNIDLRFIFLILVIIIILGYYFLSNLGKKIENFVDVPPLVPNAPTKSPSTSTSRSTLPSTLTLPSTGLNLDTIVDDPALMAQIAEIKSSVEKLTGVKNPAIYDEAFNTSKINEMLKFNLIIDPRRREPLSRSNNSFKRLLVPIHIIRLLDGKYLAVFNDGRLYTKTNLYDDKLWMGPLNNSLIDSQEDGLGMRMVMLFPLNKNGSRNIKLLGVGQDNSLYYKETEDLQSAWIKATTNNTNNDNLIYLFCDYNQLGINYYPVLYGITTDGDFVSKLMSDNSNPTQSIEEDEFMKLSFKDPEPAITNNIKVLKIFWDKNGFMLGLGTDFRIYQKKGVDWKIRPWEVDETLRGANPGGKTQVIDLIMESDGRMIGLVLDSKSKPPMIKIQKQNMTYYLADFDTLEIVGKEKELYNDYELIKFKTGFNIDAYLSFLDADETLYRTNNLQALYQRSLMEDKYRLRKLCKNRSPLINEARNFDLEQKIKDKSVLIDSLNTELEGLLKTTLTTTITSKPTQSVTLK